MTDVTFYHLTETSLDEALPVLVEKALARQLTSVIQVPDADACEAIDALLWAFEPMSFLPHGRDGDEPADAHPVYVTADTANPNAARMRFLVRGSAAPDDLSPYERVAVMFDGTDDHAVTGARAQWRAFKAQGHALTYWKQAPGGKWERAA